MYRTLQNFRRSVLTGFFIMTALSAFAQDSMTVTVVGESGAQRFPIAIADFGGDSSVSQVVTNVIRNDLERSGQFKLVDASGAKGFTEATLPNYSDWKFRGVDALATGSLVPVADGRHEARFRLFDINKQDAVAGASFVVSKQTSRAAGHKIADIIYEKLTGVKGVFSTRIAYVVKNGPNRFELHIADADGQNPQPALKSKEPIISPVWSPDGSKLAYVSFENKKPVVYVHTLSTGQRKVVANFKGSNSAPAWSPDGQRLAVVLSKDGGSQIFLINADGSGIQRLSTTAGISTEPSFSPDGQSIYFTSDRGGSPQIYVMGVSGGDVRRVTFEGNYNVSPQVSPDGKMLAYITRTDGAFRLAVLNLENRQTQILTDSNRDESPSFAPNGQVIIYATVVGGRGVLSTVTVDGRFRQRLSFSAGDIREPAWGPFTN